VGIQEQQAALAVLADHEFQQFALAGSAAAANIQVRIAAFRWKRQRPAVASNGPQSNGVPLHLACHISSGFEVVILNRKYNNSRRCAFWPSDYKRLSSKQLTAKLQICYKVTRGLPTPGMRKLIQE
jgi:hypothetical protein